MTGADQPSSTDGARRWDENEARARLVRTWYAFFAPFGRLTPTQRRALPEVVAGGDLLLAAPTASGKTEALVAPLVESILATEREPQGIRLLIVAPTRALAQDLHGRLEAPLARLNLDVAIRTGDRRSLRARRPQPVLVTTPESLDSLMTRDGASLDGLQAVMVDEAHVLDGGPRGDQLAMLLRRLRLRCARAGTAMLRLVGATASVDDADGLALRLLGAHARAVRVPHDEARPRPIDLELVQAVTLDDVAAWLRERAAEDRRLRRIVFVGRRSDAEGIGQRLRGERVVVHHGSLSTAERERAEQALRTQPGTICVCTSTLEVGIDIGGVDEAVLVGPPPDVSSFVQRAGRAGRRAARIRCVGLWNEEADRVRFEVMHALASEGRMLEERPASRPSVLAQQLVSSVFEAGLAPVDRAVARRLEGDADRWSADELDALFAALRGADLLHGDSKGRHAPSLASQQMHEKGTLHANLPARREVPAVDALTNRVIGTVDLRRVYEQGRVAIGGATRRVVSDDGRSVRVGGRGKDRGDGVALFVPGDAPRLGRALARALGEAAGQPPDVLRVVCDLYGTTLIHWQGTLWGELLSGVARTLGWKPKGGGAVALSLGVRLAHVPPTLGDDTRIEMLARAAFTASEDALIKRLEPGPFQTWVPPAMTRAWLAESVDLDAFRTWLRGVRLELWDEEG